MARPRAERLNLAETYHPMFRLNDISIAARASEPLPAEDVQFLLDLAKVAARVAHRALSGQQRVSVRDLIDGTPLDPRFSPGGPVA